MGLSVGPRLRAFPSTGPKNNPGVLMASKGRVARALSVVFSGGALGASLVLALSSTEASAEANPAVAQSAAAGSVAERLRAIRAGVDDLRSEAGPGSADP